MDTNSNEQDVSPAPQRPKQPLSQEEWTAKVNALFSNGRTFVSELIRKKACQVVRHSCFKIFDYEDIEQELKIELSQKFRFFNPHLACEATFVSRIIENKAISLIRSHKAKKRDLRYCVHSLNENVHDAEGNSVERSETIEASSARAHTGQDGRSHEEQSQLQLDIAEVFEALPDELCPLAELLTEMSEYATCCVSGNSRRKVANDVARLRGLMENANLRNYL